MRTVKRAFSVLEAFNEDRRTLALHEIAQIVNLTSPTTLRIIKALVNLGYLVRLNRNEYCLSPKVLRFASAVKSTLGIREISYDVNHDLAERTKESVALYMIDGAERVCIYAIDSELRLQTVIREGDRAALGQGASGKVILAYQDPKTIQATLADLHAKLGTDPDKLVKELEQIREHGYAESRYEVTAGNAAVAAPIFEMDGSVKFALSLACPESRYTDNRNFFVTEVVDSARLISLRIGATDEASQAEDTASVD
ncbi:IclR family transcriptional regulator [Thalassovita sp.]|uniref:IclR family transcriptional regulator n=1 Tax=Thalassovita sp. TaxID=1979401 RepID=UPI0029DE5DAD|nr:IclR family transcriptional regulator [Thalassovita sp.]